MFLTPIGWHPAFTIIADYSARTDPCHRSIFFYPFPLAIDLFADPLHHPMSGQVFFPHHGYPFQSITPYGHVSALQGNTITTSSKILAIFQGFRECLAAPDLIHFI